MAVVLHTSLGDVKLELFCDTAPRTSYNFLALAGSGYYDNTLFHRNIKGFMLQGGDPTGKGKGGQSIWGGKFADEFHPDNKHNKRGIVSMANSGPNTNASQFFITYAKHAHLDGAYTVFGRVIDGLDTLDAMERTPVDEKHRPKPAITLEKVVIHANPIADQMIVYPSATGPPEHMS
jgi:peptidyl-prolyl cis-trans isomerase-like 3